MHNFGQPALAGIATFDVRRAVAFHPFAPCLPRRRRVGHRVLYCNESASRRACPAAGADERIRPHLELAGTVHGGDAVIAVPARRRRRFPDRARRTGQAVIWEDSVAATSVFAGAVFALRHVVARAKSATKACYRCGPRRRYDNTVTQSEAHGDKEIGRYI